jgi:hypothetical protein
MEALYSYLQLLLGAQAAKAGLIVSISIKHYS